MVPAPITPDFVRRSLNGAEAVWNVPLGDGGFAFMCVRESNYYNDRRHVVMVDAQKLLQLWRQEPYSIHADVSHGSPSSWMHDYKYEGAAAGFAHGMQNPVPLAQVACRVHEEHMPVFERRWGLFRRCVGYESHRLPYVSFGDGITRTIWLLTNGAVRFPVECSESSARVLAEAAGVEGGCCRTVAHLTRLAA